jgi:hypothetical protein
MFRLNEKLAALVGDPLIGQVASTINRIHAYLAKLIWEHSIDELLLVSALQPLLTDSIPLILRDTGFRLRFDDWSSLRPREDNPFVRVNLPFPIDGFGSSFFTTVAEIISKLTEYVARSGGPLSFADNAYYIWMAAVLDGFFREEDFDSAAASLVKNFGSITQQPQMGDKVMQIGGVLDILSYITHKETDRVIIDRAAKFLGRAHCVLVVRDKLGTVLATGLPST